MADNSKSESYGVIGWALAIVWLAFWGTIAIGCVTAFLVFAYNLFMFWAGIIPV